MELRNTHATQTGVLKSSTAKMLLFFSWLMLMVLFPGNDTIANDHARLVAEKAIGHLRLNNDSALYYGRLGMEQLNASSTPADSALVFLAYGVALKQRGDRSQATSLLQQARQAAIAGGDSGLIYRALTQQAIMFREERQFEQARQSLEEALHYFETTGDTVEVVTILFELGRLWYEKGRNATALHYFIRALETPGLADPVAIAGINRSVGSTYQRLGQLFSQINPEKATTYFEEAYRYTSEAFMVHQLHGDRYGSCLCHVGMLEAALSLNSLMLADSILQQASPCAEVPDYHIRLTLLMAQATLAERTGNHEEAVRLLQQVTTFNHRYLAPRYYHDAYLRLAILARQKELHDSAYRTATYASSWFETNNLHVKAYQAHHRLALWNEQDGLTNEALTHRKHASRLKNALIAEADTETFDELQHKYESGVLQTRLDDAERYQVLQRRRIIMLVLLFVLTAATLTMGIILLTVRRRKSLLMHRLAEEKAARMEEQYKAKQAELEKTRVEKELVEETARTHRIEAEMKEQELIIHTLRQASEAGMSREIGERFAPFLSRLHRKKDREEFDTLLSDLQNGSNDDPLGHFEVVFKQAHGGFYSRLAEQCPVLSRAEMQLAAMLRLNLTSKEIAQVMNLTVASVDKTRHQLRKKLRLQPGQNLGGYLMQV